MEVERFSLVIPAYNEEHRIEKTLEEVIAYFKPRRPFEVLVVDDGSKDQTADRVKRYVEQFPEVKLLQSPSNAGKGAAVRQGMLAATGQVICFSDADLSTPVSELEKLLPLLKSFDVVIASRMLPDSDISVSQSWIRRLLGQVFRGLVKGLFSIPFSDTQCGFKCFRREAAREIFSRTQINGFVFDVEVLLLAQRMGYSICEVPVRWADSSSSTVVLRRHLPQICRDLWRIRAGMKSGRYYPDSADRVDQGEGSQGCRDSHEGLDTPSMPPFHVEETLRYRDG